MMPLGIRAETTGMDWCIAFGVEGRVAPPHTLSLAVCVQLCVTNLQA